MKRTFALGSAAERRLAVIEVDGPRVVVAQKKPDGSIKRSEKTLANEADARSECERLARELISRGYVEHTSAGPRKARPADALDLSDALEGHEEAAGPALPRVSAGSVAAPVESSAKKKTGGKKKKKRKKAADDNALDKRVIGAIVAVVAGGMAFLGYVAYDAFIKPPTIVGTWKGSMVEYEIGKPMIYSQYALLLDDKKRASMTFQEKFTSVGTYTVERDRLKLTLRDEDGDTDERQYRIGLGRSTLDLYDPRTDKHIVQLIRFREPPVIRDIAPRAAPPQGDMLKDDPDDPGEGPP